MPSFVSAATVLASLAFSVVSVSAFDAAASDNLAVYWVRLEVALLSPKSLLTSGTREPATARSPLATFATTTQSTSSQLDSSMPSQMRLEAMAIRELILETPVADSILRPVDKPRNYWLRVQALKPT
jgi:hypothetical protein